MTTLNQIDIEDFWLRCFFNPGSSLKIAAIDRAYRDFNRTLHKISEKQSKERHTEAQNLMLSIIDEVCCRKFHSQAEYDLWHEEKCLDLKTLYKRIFDFGLYIGQAQKWINMTFKYLSALGEKRITGIGTNYHFFHFPIDNIIQKIFSKEMNIQKLKGSWSRIDDYRMYLNYQNLIRTKYPDQIPMDVEFRLFNGDTSLWIS